MRLYLSSFRIGNKPEALLALLKGGVRTALILNADDYKSTQDRAASLQREVAELRSVGLNPAEVDLRDFFGSNEELGTKLSEVDLVYVRGGNVFLLRRALRQSGADHILTDLLRRDAVAYAGYSAGSCILRPTLHGIEGDEDDPHYVPDGYDEAVVWSGLGILPFAIAPHDVPDAVASAAKRSIEYYVEHHIPFVALRDGQALVIDDEDRHIVG